MNKLTTDKRTIQGAFAPFFVPVCDLLLHRFCDRFCRCKQCLFAVFYRLCYCRINSVPELTELTELLNK